MGRVEGDQRIPPRHGDSLSRGGTERPPYLGRTGDDMTSRVAGLTLLLIGVLPACTLFHGSTSDNPTVDLTLNWDGTACKAAVPEEIHVSKDGARITWNVTDNCNQTERENETQFVFKYESQ